MHGDEIHRGSGEAGEKAERLLEKGLRCYSRGDIQGAMSEWERVLSLVPQHERALRYLKLVKEQYPIGNDDLRRATGSADVPYGLEDLPDGPGDDTEAYALLEIYKEPNSNVDFDGSERTRGGAYASNLDEGWFLEDIPLNLNRQDNSGEFKAQETFKKLADGLLENGEFEESARTDYFSANSEDAKTRTRSVGTRSDLSETDFSDLSVYGDNTTGQYPGLAEVQKRQKKPSPAPPSKKDDKTWMEMLALEPEPPPAAMKAEAPVLGLDAVLSLADQELSAVPEPIPAPTSMLDIEPMDEMQAVPEPIPTPVRTPYSEGKPLNNPFAAGADVPSTYTAKAAPETEALDLGRELASEVFGESKRAQTEPSAPPTRMASPTRQPPPTPDRSRAPTAQPPVAPPISRAGSKPTFSPPVRSKAPSTTPPKQIVLNAPQPPSRHQAPTSPPPVTPPRAKAPPSTAPPKQIVLNAGLPRPTAQPPARARVPSIPPPRQIVLNADPAPRGAPPSAQSPISPRQTLLNQPQANQPPGRASTLRGQPPLRGVPSIPPPIPFEVPEPELLDFGTFTPPAGENTLDLKEEGRLGAPRPENTFSDSTVDLERTEPEQPAFLRNLPNPPVEALPEPIDIVPGSERLANLYREGVSTQAPVSDPSRKESVQVATARIYGEADHLCNDNTPADEKVRTRVNFFFERAEKEFSNENLKLAAAILELALDEAPGSAVAQKAIQSNRDLILEIYRGYLGNLKAVVTISLPMQQLSKYELDPRAAFLLSRIDGTMSIEDILDISGMPALEAYQILSKLRMQGIIDLR